MRQIHYLHLDAEQVIQAAISLVVNHLQHAKFSNILNEKLQGNQKMWQNLSFI